jgi:transcriptional regulator with XRE-family HTH domain
MVKRADTAEAFKSWRKEMGITVEQAAQLLGKAVITIYAYQSGHRKVMPTTFLLMKALAAGYRPTEPERSSMAA